MCKITLQVFVFLVLAGCATFKPEWKYQDLMNAHRPTAAETHNGLEITVEDTSSEKSRKIFDADVRSHGVLAVFIRASNKSSSIYRVSGTQAKAAMGDQSLPLLRGIDAADLAGTRGVAGKAALWFLAGGATGVAISGFNSASVNYEIEHHFENLEFGDATLQPKQVIGGFIYLKVPETGKQAQNVNIEIPAAEDKSGVQITFKFAINF